MKLPQLRGEFLGQGNKREKLTSTPGREIGKLAHSTELTVNVRTFAGIDAISRNHNAAIHDGALGVD